MRLKALSISAIGALMALAVVVQPVMAAGSTVYVTPTNMQGWVDSDQRFAGASVISSEVADTAGGTASLKQTTTGSADKTNMRKLVNLGPVSDLSALSFDWYRVESSTAAGHLTPAFGVYVSDATGQNSWLLKWEGVYNEYPVASGNVPTDEWIPQNILGANFWRIPQMVNGAFVGMAGCNTPGNSYECFNTNRKLTDSWLNGFSVAGIEVGLGSGWGGTYSSYVDNITVGSTTYNFELAAPLPVRPTSKEECMYGNWEDGFQTSYKNQGQCVSSVTANGNASFKRVN